MPAKSPAKPNVDKRVATTKKSVVSTTEHSELLLWLVDHHESICRHYHAIDETRFEWAVADAVRRFRDKCGAMKRGVEVGANDDRLSPHIRELCKKRLNDLERLGSDWERPRFDELGASEVIEISVQARTYEAVAAGRPKGSKPQGFVDLQVVSAIPRKLRVGFAGDSLRAEEDMDEDMEAALIAISGQSFPLDEHELATELLPVTWRTERFAFRRTWFDVWPELPSLGDLLQHLKVLDELNAPYHDSSSARGLVETRTCLVVPEISQAMADIIEKEGFAVISRKTMDAAIAPKSPVPAYQWR